MLEVMQSKCDQCLFSKERIVDKKRMAQILNDCRKNDSYFICHKSTIEGGSACCSAFYETQNCNLIRIAQRLGAVKFVATPHQSE